jgi:hypothetical protein
VTGDCRSVSERPIASAAASPNPRRGEGGCHPACRLELSGGTGGSAGNNTATDLEFPDPTANGLQVDTSRIPSAAGRGSRRISGLWAAPDTYAAIDVGELGLRVQ